MTNNLSERDRLLRLKAIMLYIIQNIKPEKRTVYFIVKAAFLAHQKHMVDYCVPMLEDTIKALKFGPVPSDIYDILKITRGEDKVYRYHKNTDLDIILNALEFEDEFYSTKENPDLEELSPAVMDCLNAAIEMANRMTFDEVVRTTHKGEWYKAFNNPVSHVMDDISIAKEAGISQDGLEYLKYSLDLDKLLK